MKQVQEFSYTPLLNWFNKNARPLPWREHYDPYAVVVSEYMLQQTQIKTALPYYERWLKRWPDWHALAKAKEDQVHKLWEGLGYYRRARMLHNLAKFVSQELNGQLPKKESELIKLPGIGVYTSAAIASIAFNVAAFPIDGNVRRVLARYFADERVSGDAAQDEFFKEQMVPVFQKIRKRRELAQALMELGALICSPKNTSCEICPINKTCGAYALDKVSELPQKKKKSAPKPLYLGYCWLVHSSGAVLLKQRPDVGRFAGLWEAPSVELKKPESVKDELKKKLKTDELQKMEPFRRDFTTYKVTWMPFKAECETKFKIKDYEWVSAKKLEGLNLVPVMRKHYDQHIKN